MGVKCTNCGTEHGDWIPKDRLDTVAEQRRELQKKLETTETELKQVRDEFAARKKDLETFDATKSELEAYKAKEASWGLERSIIRAGITDDEGVEFAALAWQRIPEDKRPEGGITAWLADREALPKAVRAYLPAENASQAAQGGQQGQGTANASQGAQTASAGAREGQQGQDADQPAQGGQQGQGQPHPRSTQGMDPNASGPAPRKFTADQIRAMSNEEYLRHRDAINAQQGAA